MAEHPDDRRHPRPIVPDPDASLSAPRPRYPAPPRVWPLWLLILLMIAAGTALAWAGWQERVRLQAELARVSGELSNVHARFDAQQGRGEALDALQSRLDELTNLEAEIDAVLDRRLMALRQDIEADRIAPLEASLASFTEQAETLDATLDATRTSLNALERAGEEGRTALSERLAILEQTIETEAKRRERLINDAEALRERTEALSVRLTSLDEQVEAIAGSRDDERRRMEAQESEIREMASGLRELRQSQLALSAQLEALRQ